MRTIRVDDEVWSALQKRAKAFEDTPNSVLRRNLNIDKNHKKKRAPIRVARGGKTPQIEFRQPILRALYEAGGAGKTADVVDRVGKLMAGRLNEIDQQPLSSGEIRWRNTAEWERNAMVREGLLKKSSPKGIWELTAKGIAAVESQSDREG